jgi:pyruvate/2-oxoglutarate dehydrogenase complex dihydrolipoamide acyltransferase (E2) component
MEFCVPDLGEGVYEAELVEWLVPAGRSVQPGDALAEVMTDKATIELPATFAGTVDAHLVQPGDTIQVGQVLLRYRAIDGQETPQKSPDVPVSRRSAGTITAAQHADAPSDKEGSRRVCSPAVLAAPAVRKMAQSLGVKLDDLTGSGPGGRILIDDVGQFVRSQDQARKPERRFIAAEPVSPGQRIPLQGLRRSIADHMVTAKQTIPHYSYIDECDVSNMVALRNSLKRPLYASGIKLTNLPFYVKAAVGALQQVPLVNSSLDESTGEIELHKRYDIGIATATSKGLMVPVIRDADQKNLPQLAEDIERLIRAAQAGTIGRSELRGGTFTISSIGNFGGLVSTPIIHHPEVGIVAIGKIFRRPTFNDQGEIVPADIVYLSFSFDHRVVDGSVGAQFGNAMIQQLQDPQTLASGIDGH